MQARRPSMPILASRTDRSVLGSGLRATNTLDLHQSSRTDRTQHRLFSCKTSTRLGFQNLQSSLQRSGGEGARLQDDLTTHLIRLDIPICGLAGAWCWDAGEHHSEHHTIYWSGSQSQRGHGCGVGICVHKNAVDSLLGWGAKGDRLLWARFEGVVRTYRYCGLYPHGCVVSRYREVIVIFVCVGDPDPLLSYRV